LKPKQMWYVEYDADVLPFTFHDIVLLTDEEAKLVEARLTRAQESGYLVDYKMHDVEELCNYEDLLETMELNDIPE
jgi:hypothetical protein